MKMHRRISFMKKKNSGQIAEYFCWTDSVNIWNRMDARVASPVVVTNDAEFRFPARKTVLFSFSTKNIFIFIYSACLKSDFVNLIKSIKTIVNIYSI